MDSNSRDYVKNLVKQMAPIFKQDVDMARGRYNVGGTPSSNRSRSCAPHTYVQRESGGIWICACGQALPRKSIMN